jgi:arginine N-succinyltransferase
VSTADPTGFLVRPARPADLDDLVALAGALGSGLTNLPPDRERLAERIEDSLASFARRVRAPAGEWYLFVLCDPGGRVRGTSALIGRVGGFDPYYAYEVRRERHVHAPMGVDREVAVLHLRREHKGPSELASLAVDPALRGGGLGRVMSLVRLLFVAAHPERFADTLIAELRGYQDADGRSPFWEGVGRRFFLREFHEADFLSGIGNKDFIEDLMPRHPIYVDLLPDDVREAIGRPHAMSAPALRMLEEEGFRHAGHVDIFDAGPIVAAPVARVGTVRAHRRITVRGILDAAPPGDPVLVSNGRLDLRAAAVRAEIDDRGWISLAGADARRLEVGLGDVVQVVPRG